MLHYRGFSGSSGEPSEAALHQDAELLYEFVKAKHGNITVMGRSLGSGLAIRLAAIKAIEKLVLITPYDSILNLAKQRFPYLPVEWMLFDRFESWRYAPQVKAPTVILATDADQVYRWKIPQLCIKGLIRGLLRHSKSLKTQITSPFPPNRILFR